MSALKQITALLQDPPPEFAFEIAADGIAMSRTRPPAGLQNVPQHAAIAPGVLEPSPVKGNVLDVAAFAEVVRKLVPAASGKGKRSAALILPDNCVRIAVLDFDTLPEKEEERLSLIRFRLRKSVPFDIDEAALSYFPQSLKSVIAVIAPSEIIAQYEAPFRAAGLHPGLVTISSLAMLELLPVTGSLLLARISPGALTILAVKDGLITIARSLEMAAIHSLEEVSAAIYPTMAYIEDQSGGRPEQLFVAGFGNESFAAATQLSVELEVPVEPLSGDSPGLAGYLASIKKPVKAPVKAKAA
jgi:type IV pilus assembly protein PilM